MAIFRWRGTTSSAFNTDSNWVDGAGVPYAAGRYPGSVPATFDDVYYDASVALANAPAGGNYAAGEDLTSLNIGPAFDADLASAGTFLEVPVITVNVEGSACGDIYLHADVGVACSVVCRALKSGSTLFLDGDVRDLYALAGDINCENAWAANNEVVVGYVTAPSAGATVTIPSTGAAPSNGIIQSGGTLDTVVSITLHQCGGASTLRAGATTVRLTGGTCSWTAAAITTLEALGGGTFTANLSVAAAITNLTIGEGATVDIRNPLSSYTNLTNMGGLLRLPLEP